MSAVGDPAIDCITARRHSRCGRKRLNQDGRHGRLLSHRRGNGLHRRHRCKHYLRLALSRYRCCDGRCNGIAASGRVGRLDWSGHCATVEQQQCAAQQRGAKHKRRQPALRTPEWRALGRTVCLGARLRARATWLLLHVQMVARAPLRCNSRRQRGACKLGKGVAALIFACKYGMIDNRD